MREILHNILLFLALTKPRGMLCPNGTVKPFLVSLVEPVAYLKSELSNDQPRSHAGHEPDQGLVSRMGHSLWRYTSLRSVPSFGMVEQDSGSRRASSRRALLRTARCPAGFAQTSAAGSVGREQNVRAGLKEQQFRRFDRQQSM